MTRQYTCALCKKVFHQKIDLTRHENKKSPCITLDEIQRMNETKGMNEDFKGKLINVFKNCLNVLRDNEGLTGEKALRNLSYLLIFKLIEPHMGKDIDIDNFDYDFGSYFVEENIEHNKKRLLSCVRFSNFCNEPVENMLNMMKHVWDIILSEHPSTKNIFLKDTGFDIKRSTTLKKLIDRLQSLDFTNCEYDVLGNAYEEVIQDIMTGKVLGQFFTPPLVKKMMVKLIDPQIYPDGKIDTCGDPTMGTGGFLITYIQYIMGQATAKNITPDWDFIRKEGIYGKELEPDTYQLAVSNMLISSGHMFETLERGDSIRVPILRKFDTILANPPFGIKGLKYEDFNFQNKHEYLPIKTDNAVSLFLQSIIYMLKSGGKCAVVLPDGQDLFSKTNKTLIAVREYLMKTCDLKEIIYLPSGIFTYTSIKTCVFYFVKKREGNDVLGTKIKRSKTHKETSRDYTFSKTHQTTKVKFYDYNPYEDIKNLLVEVPIEKIASNFYSLNYAEYMKDETEEEQYAEGVVVKTLGEVCKFLPKSKRNAKYGNKEGLYPFFKSSTKIDSYVDEPDYTEESLIIGDGGEPNINYGIKFSTSNHCYILQNKNRLLLNLKYGYYYLYHNLDMMSQLYTGVAIKNITKTNIEGINIPIPSLDKQKEIVEYLDLIYEKANKTSHEKIMELKQLNEFCIKMQKGFGENVVKTLGEVCKDISTSKNIASSKRVDGLYRFFTCSREETTHNEYHYDGTFIIHGSRGSTIKESIFMTNKEKFAIGTSMFISEVKNNNECLTKYIYYYLKLNQYILDKYINGSAIPMINKSNYYDIKIPIPSLERQQEIVEYCEYNDTLITQLEKEIENNKKIANQFLTGILQGQV